MKVLTFGEMMLRLKTPARVNYRSAWHYPIPVDEFLTIFGWCQALLFIRYAKIRGKKAVLS